MSAETQDRYAGQWTDFDHKPLGKTQFQFVAACNMQVLPVNWLIDRAAAKTECNT